MDKELLLYNYFSNQLTPEQQRLFKELLQTDADFKQQFDFEKDLKQVIGEKEVGKLKAKLVGFEKEVSKDATPVRTLTRTNYRKWAMAASVALLIGLGWFGYQNFAGPDYDKLYDDNFQHYPNTVYAITRGESTETMERAAFSAYELGDYQTAIRNFNSIPKTDSNGYLDFYLGLSHLNLGQTDEAKAFFEKVIASNAEFKPEAHWYLALAALKQEKKEEARRYLETLVSTYDYNKEKAKQLLVVLE